MWSYNPTYKEHHILVAHLSILKPFYDQFGTFSLIFTLYSLRHFFEIESTKIASKSIIFNEDPSRYSEWLKDKGKYCHRKIAGKD